MLSAFLSKGLLLEMGSEKKKSYVRLKVWPTILVTIFGFIYSSLGYVSANYSVEQLSLKQIGAFIFAMAGAFYGENIKCERCKTKWHKTGHETYEDAVSMLDFVRKFVNEKNYWINKKCRICGLERY